MANCKDCFHRAVCDGDIGYGYFECPQYINTADVVPREEVDHLRHMLDSYAIQYGTVKDQHAVIDRIKSETAMEIFAEIEKCLLAQEVVTEQVRVKEVGEWILHDYLPRHFAELKKKYTGGSTDGKRTDR